MKRLLETQIEKPQTLQFPIFPEHYGPRAHAEKGQGKDDGLSGRVTLTEVGENVWAARGDDN